MRCILLALLLTSKVFAQNIDAKHINDIALMEQMAHERLLNSANATGASNNFDVKYYRCEWDVDPGIRYISGSVTIYYKIISISNSISLDLMNLGLVTDSVIQRSRLLPFVHSHDVLQVNFPSSAASGAIDSITVFYHGVPPNTGFGSFVQATHAGIPIIWTLSEPYGSRDWWPCKNGLDDKADSIDVYISSPVQYQAASNGLLQGEVITGAKKITHWKHRYPIATYLICFAVTNYSVFTNSVQLGTASLPMVTFCYPENLALFQANTPLVLNALQLYHNTFSDYPFLKEKYGHVQFGWGGGQEHQTSTFIVTPNEGLMAHELAHQWFGDKVTCGSWRDVWLNEGFATFVASYYSEQNYPANTLNTRRNEIAAITAIPDGSVWVDDTTNVNRIFDGRLTYNKGSHLLYMLRWKLGDSAFFKGIRKYITDPTITYGFAVTDDLKRNLEQSSGQDLTEFFNDWFYGQGYPSYQVKWSMVGSSFVKTIVNQVTSHSSVRFFPMPLALQFKNATQQKTIIVNNIVNGESFYNNIGFVPDTVLIDPEYWLITRNNSSHKIVDSINGQNIVQVFPSPMHDDVYVYLRNFSWHSAKINILNAAGQLVYQKSISINGSEFVDISMTGIASGAYFVSIMSGNEVLAVKKIVKY